MLYIFTFISITILIFVNGFTDAPNSITTIVSTKVMSFKKASLMSAIFNVIGILVMSIVNFKVADGISSIVVLKQGRLGLIALLCSILSCSLFSIISSLFGIPTSETHGLISGLTGSCIAIGNFKNINFKEWLNVIIGLIWSVFGVFIIVKILFKIFKTRLYKINLNKIKKYQKFSSYSLSFMSGAQDGQKFIGLMILYIYIVKGTYHIYNSLLWIIIYVSIIMFFGVKFRGKKDC